MKIASMSTALIEYNVLSIRKTRVFYSAAGMRWKISHFEIPDEFDVNAS